MVLEWKRTGHLQVAVLLFRESSTAMSDMPLAKPLGCCATGLQHALLSPQ